MTHARLVFDTKGLGRLPFYILSYLVVYAFNALSLEGLLSVGFQPIVAQGMIVLPAAILAFIPDFPCADRSLSMATGDVKNA